MNVKKLALPVLREAFPSRAKYEAMCAEVDKMVDCFRPRVKRRPRDLALREQIRQQILPLIDKSMRLRSKLEKQPFDLLLVHKVSTALVDAMVEVVMEEICLEQR